MATSHSRTTLAPAAAGRLALDGCQLYWESYGSEAAPAVLLLHHGLGSVRSWKRQISPLAAAGWRVVAYDRWGYGRSVRRPEFQPGFLRQDVEHCRRLLEALGIGACAVVGHSDGGSIGLMLAALHPARVSRLVVVAAHIYVEPKMQAGLELIERQAASEPLKGALQREHGQRGQELAAAWIKHWRQSDPTELDLRPLLSMIECPALVIQGALDEHATDQHARDIAEAIPGADLWLIPEVGHMPPHQVPERFNRRVLEFLGQPL